MVPGGRLGRPQQQQPPDSLVAAAAVNAPASLQRRRCPSPAGPADYWHIFSFGRSRSRLRHCAPDKPAKLPVFLPLSPELSYHPIDSPCWRRIIAINRVSSGPPVHKFDDYAGGHSINVCAAAASDFPIPRRPRFSRGRPRAAPRRLCMLGACRASDLSILDQNRLWTLSLWP